MKKLLSLIFVLASVIPVNAQPGWYAVFSGDTAILSVSGANGAIQWQQCEDSLTWADIPGATATPYTIITTASGTGKRFFRAKITNAVICENSSWYSSIICHKVLTSTTQVGVGNWFHGGIVFYTNGTGQGLIAPQQDQSANITWGCADTSIPGALSTTDGAANTAAILTDCATRPIAASVCDALTLNGYTDWFLPAKDQLNYLYQQKNLVGGFNNVYYWNSTEYSAGNACIQGFISGDQGSNNKDLNLYMRCVRSFSPTDSLTHTNSGATVTAQPVAVTLLSTQPASQNKCLSSSVTFSLFVNGTPAFSYQWKKNGADITNATNSNYTISNLSLSDEGLYSCEVSNLCRSVLSNQAELKVIQLTASTGIAGNLCPGQSTTLSSSASSNHPAESVTYTFSWSPATALTATNVSNPTADPDTTTNYIITVTDIPGCTATDTVNVFVQNVFQDEQICLVTVDTIAWKNKVMWEGTPGVGTAKYWIYKEVITNVYNWIGEVIYGGSSYFIDNASNPESHSDRYKITVIDTCNGESARSAYHNTMNLVVSVFGSTMGLVWTPYQTEDGSYTPDQYYIYKGPTPQTMSLLTTVTGSQNTYNDVNVFDLQYYMIGAHRDCNTNPAYSNKRDNGLVGAETLSLTGTILISPNPMITSTTLEIPNLKSEILNPKSEGSFSNFEFRIFDLTGKVVRSEPISPSRHPEFISGSPLAPAHIIIERGNLKPGVYFVELKADRTYRGKLIIE